MGGLVETKTRYLNMHFTPQEYEQLEDIARKLHKSKATIVKGLVEDLFDEVEWLKQVSQK